MKRINVIICSYVALTCFGAETMELEDEYEEEVSCFDSTANECEQSVYERINSNIKCLSTMAEQNRGCNLLIPSIGMNEGVRLILRDITLFADAAKDDHARLALFTLSVARHVVTSASRYGDSKEREDAQKDILKELGLILSAASMNNNGLIHFYVQQLSDLLRKKEYNDQIPAISEFLRDGCNGVVGISCLLCMYKSKEDEFEF